MRQQECDLCIPNHRRTTRPAPAKKLPKGEQAELAYRHTRLNFGRARRLDLGAWRKATVSWRFLWTADLRTTPGSAGSRRC